MRNEKEVFEMYVIDDGIRPVLKTPFMQDGYVYATDGNILIRVRESSVSKLYPRAEKPNASSVFIDTRKEEILTINQLKKMLSKVELIEETREVGEDIECEECKGCGEVTWSYEGWEKEFECPVCDGSGFSSRVQEEPTGGMIPNPFATVRLGDKLFMAGRLETIAKTMDFLGVREITMQYNEKSPREAAMFSFSPEVDVLLTPVSC